MKVIVRAAALAAMLMRPVPAEPAAAPMEFSDSTSHAAAVPVHGHAEDPDEEGHGFHRNHVAVFGGVTLREEDADMTAGLDWEVRLGTKAGMLILGEAVFAEETEQIFGLGMTWHASDAIRIALVPAWEMAGEHQAFLFRMGVEYGFHFGTLGFAPGLNLDLAGGHVALVAGIAVGSGF